MSYYLVWLQDISPGQEGAREIMGWALGLLDALEILGLIKASMWLVLILAATLLLFRVFGVGKLG